MWLIAIFFFGTFAVFAYSAGVGFKNIEERLKMRPTFYADSKQGLRSSHIDRRIEAKPQVVSVRIDRDHIDYANLIVLYLAFCAATFAGYESLNLAKDTEEATRHADKAAEDEHRPWIIIEGEDEERQSNIVDRTVSQHFTGIQARETPIITGADGKLRLGVVFNFKNIGRSMAFVGVRPAVVRFDNYIKYTDSDWERKQRDACNNKGQDADPKRWLIAPNGGTFPYDYDVEIASDDMNAIRNSDDPYRFKVVGCIFYRVPQSSTVYTQPFVATTSVEPPNATWGREVYGPFSGRTVKVGDGMVLKYKNILLEGDVR